MVKTSYYLFKKIFREIFSNWKQFISMLLIGTIAVTLFVGLSANAQSLSERVEHVYQEGNMADLWVTTTTYDEADLSNIERLVDGKVEERNYFYASLDGRAAYMVINETYPEISKPWNVISRSTTFDKDYFFMVDEALTKESASGGSVISLGSEVEVVLPMIENENLTLMGNLLNPYLKEGGTNIFLEEEFVLNGEVNAIMNYPENITVASYSRSAFLMSENYFLSMLFSTFLENFNVTQQTLMIILSLVDFNDLFTLIPHQYVIKLDEIDELDETQEAINNYFEAKTDNNLVGALGRDSMPFSSGVEAEISNAQNLTLIFPVVFFIVALLVILTTSSQIILKERTLIGSLKAIGIPNRLIYAQYMAMVGGVVLFGTIVGEILGPLLIPFIMGQKYNILYSLPGMSLFTFPVLVGSLTAVLFLLSACLVTYLVAHKTVKMLPAISMRPTSPHIKGFKKKKAKSKRQGPAYLSILIALRNIRTNIAKSMMVVIGVAGCTALLVCGFGIEDTINNSVNKDLEYFYNADLEVNYTVGSRIEKMEADFAPFSFVDSYQPIYRDLTSVEEDSKETDYDTTLFVLGGNHDHFKVEMTSNDLLITNKVASEYGLELGDSISFEMNNAYYSGTITIIEDFFTCNGVFVLSSFFTQDIQDTIAYTTAFVYLVDGTNPEEAKEEIEASGISGYSSSITKEERAAQISDVVSGIMIMTTAVKTFAILLAIVVLYNLALLNFRERIRDIATLKVLGFSKIEISMSLVMEIMTLTTLGVGAGLALGRPFMDAVLAVNEVPLVYFINTVAPFTYIIAFLLTFVLALLVNVYLSLLTKKVKMVESLKSVE